MKKLFLIALLLSGCVVTPPEPVVDFQRAPIAFAMDAKEDIQTFFDLGSWITPKEELALNDFLNDAPSVTNPKIVNGKEYPGPIGETWGWKGTHNTNGYGFGDWVLNAAKRHDHVEAFKWLRKHCLRNLYNYWLYFVVKGRGPNEGTGYEYVNAIPGFVQDASMASGIPAVDLIVKYQGRYLVPKVYSWDGSSYARHHCYDFMAHAILEPRVGFTDDEKELIVQMLVHYARGRMETTKLPAVTHRHEWAHYYVRTYVAIYQTFKTLYKDSAERGEEPSVKRWELAKQCLQAAEGIVWYGFHPNGPGFPRAVQGKDGSWLYAWDRRTPNEPGWHSLNLIYTSQPWYVGLRSSAWFYLWTEPDCASSIRDLISWVIIEEAKWCTRDWSTLPGNMVDVNGTLRSHNGWLQGGLLPFPGSSRWIFENTKLLSASEWSKLPDDVEYHPLTCIKYRETDDGYFHQWWPDGAVGQKERWHYPKVRVNHDPWPDAFGPRIDINGGASWCGMPDVLFLAGLLTGNKEWMRTGVWLCHDYLAFMNINHSGSTLCKSKSNALVKWYGFYKSRSFQWGTLACGEILRKMILDGNYWLQF